MLEVVASHCKVSWMPLDFGVDALDCDAHHTPEARGSRAALAFEEREDIRPEPDDGHVPDLFCGLKVNLFVFAIYNAGPKDWNRFQNIAIISVIPDIVKAGYRGYQYGENTGNILVIPDISARGKKRQAPFF